LADPELAEQRFMATKPAFRHLAHGLFKLRATNRHEAAISTQHGLG
jgi:DNA-binding CsgD family transcriptional regulator